MIALIAVIVMIAGVIFIALATAGVIRFQDPLQRMHASTKAGTVGASLCLAAAAIAMGDLGAVVIALVSILFLVATLPVAGHLLGRAAYISGSPLRTGRDALKGVLPRAKSSLDDRTRSIPQRVAAAVAPAAKKKPSGTRKR
ncbi:MAG: monovalent cation/H(+) antiporter subunit G [Salinarimonadaceae bacterium]|nr:MAG: monovalent cation/H(+) antiporter subunit G [Salinarimonadaceae bacterium]